jgi:hypothetical protein
MFIMFLVAAFESMLYPQSIIIEEYYNPAKPAPYRFLASFGTRSHFGIPGLRTYTGRVSFTSFRVGIQSFGDELYRENMLTAGGRFPAGYGIAVGGELVLYHQSIQDNENRSCYSANLGTHFQSTAVEIGAWMHNLTIPRLSPVDYIPPCYSLNIMYRPQQYLSARCGVHSTELSMPFFSFGVTWMPYRIVMVGVGVNSDPLYIDYSATFVIGAVSIQYSGTNHQYLGSSHLFQLNFTQ